MRGKEDLLASGGPEARLEEKGEPTLTLVRTVIRSRPKMLSQAEAKRVRRQDLFILAKETGTTRLPVYRRHLPSSSFFRRNTVSPITSRRRSSV